MPLRNFLFIHGYSETSLGAYFHFLLTGRRLP